MHLNVVGQRCNLIVIYQYALELDFSVFPIHIKSEFNVTINQYLNFAEFSGSLPQECSPFSDSGVGEAVCHHKKRLTNLSLDFKIL